MKKAIITGATGFIGTALCKELLDNGYGVTAVIRPESAKREKIQFPSEQTGHLKVIELALEDLVKLPDMTEEADVFFHLAWNGSSGAAREDFDAQYTNIRYTALAVRTAKRCGCKKFVGAGSQAEYGVVHGIAREDETVPKPFMMYGAAKLSAYQMGRLVAAQESIFFVWPRIYSVYGVGENPGTLVNYVIDALQKGEMPQLTACENMWNFMYITDCARALRILGEREEAEGIYHVASKDTRPLKEFVEEIRDIISPGAELGFGMKNSSPERTFWLEPDVRKLRKLDIGKNICFAEGIRRKWTERLQLG